MKHNLKIGILLTILGALSYAVLAAVVKHTSQYVPMPVMVFFQSMIAFLLSLPFILRHDLPKIRTILRTAYLRTHILRTISSLGISYLLFYAVTKIPLVNAVLLSNTAPLFVPFLGFIFLRQPINHYLWPSLIIGFLGIALILHPKINNFNYSAVYALGAGVCLAISLLLVRRAVQKDASITAVFYYFLFSTFISGVVAINFWVPVSIDIFLILLLQGSLFFITQYSMASALQYAEAQVVSSLFYSNVIFAVIIAYFIWNASFSILTIAGVVLTVVGSIMTILVQKRCQKIQA